MAQNRVLSLDGDGDYVEIEDSEALNSINSQVTMEAWIKVTAFTDRWMPTIYKGDGRVPDLSNRSYILWLRSDGVLSLHSAPSDQGLMGLTSPVGCIALNTWYHVAGVIDAENGVMKILINGTEVAKRNFGKHIHVSTLPLRIGNSHEEWLQGHSNFAGQIDEVRIWNIARTQEDIRTKMHTTLSGKESGLVGYWRFDDEQNTATDSSPNHSDGKLMGDAHVVEAELPKLGELVIPTVISGMITNEAGDSLPNASVRLEQDNEEIAQTTTDASGNYQIVLFHQVRGLYDLLATSGEHGDWRLELPLRLGESQTFNLTLAAAVSIEGTLMMLDDATPHVAVPVEALSNGQVIATTLSDEKGIYRFINLKPGQYQVRCQILGGYVYYRDVDYALRFTFYDSPTKDEDTGDLLSIRLGKTLNNINCRFAPFKKGTWKTYTSLDGLGNNFVYDIHDDRDGLLWFGTIGGVSRYDGNQFITLTTEDGLANNLAGAIARDSEGALWFGTLGGVSRYDGSQFTTFTTADGLAANAVTALYCASDGALWFGTGYWGRKAGGVSRYDGKRFVSLTSEDGLAGNCASRIHEGPNGVVWFGIWGGGVSGYDGSEFVNLTAADGLPSNNVTAIHCDPDGVLWVATWGAGVSRVVYPFDKLRAGSERSRRDGNEFVNFTAEDGFLSDTVLSIYRAPDGVMWFGGLGGVSRYDGVTVVNFTEADGLANNAVNVMSRDTDGVMWFGTGVAVYTGGGGVSRYDDQTFLNFTTRDGLASNNIATIYRDPDGILWFGTNGGGAASYDGNQFRNFTTRDGLAHDDIWGIHRTSDGVMWFATRWRGVSRYDGKKFTNFTAQDGLGNNQVITIHGDSDGTMWFGTLWGGVSRYGFDTQTVGLSSPKGVSKSTQPKDGKQFTTFTGKDGMADNFVWDIYRDSDDVLWFGHEGGVTRYDGKTFVTLTEADGLVNNTVFAIYGTADGALWFGTAGGVCCYTNPNANDKKFLTFTERDGLADNYVRAIHQSADGAMWFGTEGSGVSRYDGQTWTSLDARDGLAGNDVVSIHEDTDGFLWFATDGGITRYRGSTTKPKVVIASVKTDKEYTDIRAIPSITTGQRVTIRYGGIDFKTVPAKRQYRYRLKEFDDDWRKPTTETSFDDSFLKPGSYTFEVQAIDRDLNYSEPASLTLKVVPPWYLNGWIAIPLGGGILVLLGGVIFFGVHYYTQRRQMRQQERIAREALEAKNQQIQVLNEQLQDENLRLAAELEITERIQRMILPSADELKSIADLDIAGYMQPADDVGGDYYDVLQREGTVAVSIGDVTGHGLESGLVMLMTQTAVQALLHSGETDPVHFLDTLNRTIYNNVQRMDSDKNLTLCLLDCQSGELKLSGQHEEMIVVRRDGKVELVDTIDLGFPIGLDDDIADFIDQTTVQLQPGDGVVLYTDGITEAENTAGEQYGLERLCEVVSQHWSQSAEEIKEAVIAEVQQHIGEQEVYDDITLVVLKQK